MARDLSAYLQDIHDACVAIAEVTEGVSLEEHRARPADRSSVEREFIIIGEALRRISAIDERLFHSISNSRVIIDFRNLLAHDYGAVDDDQVFGLVHSDLIVLQDEVGQLLRDLPGTHSPCHPPEPPPQVFSFATRSLRPGDGERWQHRKATAGIVDEMVALSDADNPQKQSFQSLLLQSRAKRDSPCSCRQR